MGEPCHRIEDHHTVETMKQNWKLYMNLVQERQVRNMESSKRWGIIGNIFNIVKLLMSSLTTFIAVFEETPHYHILMAFFSGFTTITTGLYTYIKPGRKKHLLQDSSRRYGNLLIRMAQCKTNKDYDDLWPRK